MTDASQRPNGITDQEVEALLQALRRKIGNWVEWGQACLRLQKAGYNPQAIFEATGFEPSQQNQIIVAMQVFTSLVNAAAPAVVIEYFQHRRSDILYEFRILTGPQRLDAATLAVEKQLDADAARDVAKALKEAALLQEQPPGFTQHPGDAVAFQCWKHARQQDDLQERSRLIARGLSYAHSDTARQEIEKLLTDFTVVKAQPAPRLPVYRLESEEELPRILPVVGRLPLTKTDLRAVPLLEETGPFRLVEFSGTGACVPVPGWQVLLNAEDPVGIFCQSDQIGPGLPGTVEEVLVIVDRAQRQWQPDGYFLVEAAAHLDVQWFTSAPTQPLLGRVIVIMRPKKVLDENYTRDPWQVDE